MQDVINMLLQKQATLDEDCEYAKMVECEKIDNAFAERKTKIKSLLDLAGYEPPVVEEASEQDDEQADTETATENVTAAYGGQTIY